VGTRKEPVTFVPKNTRKTQVVIQTGGFVSLLKFDEMKKKKSVDLKTTVLKTEQK